LASRSETLQKLIAEALPWLCTQAEKLLGGGTGMVKRAYVVQEAIKLLPEAVRAKLDPNRVYALIDTALAKLRPLWEENPALIAPDETADDETYLVAAKGHRRRATD
jgi:hypothetical protein